MKKSVWIMSGVVAALIAVTSGCNSTSGIEATAMGETDVNSKEGLSQAVMYNNSALKRSLTVTDLRSGRVGNLLKAQGTVISKTRKTLTLQYKFVWLDSDGMEIDVDSKAWNPLVIHGKESKAIQSVAHNPSAASFQLKIRDLKDRSANEILY